MKKWKIGLIGSGFAAELHMQGFKKLYGINAEVVALASRGDYAHEFAKKHRIPTVHRDYRNMLADRDIDVIDVCSPSSFHAEMVLAAIKAGKHVICEKPFIGYFGEAGDEKPVGRKVAKALMYERVLEYSEIMKKNITDSGCLFLYAENWIYAPAITKMTEMIRATQDKVLFFKAENSHNGSHSAHAAHWDISGGGSLIRMGCHPLSAVLYLKQAEAKARGEKIGMASVVCDVGNLAKNLTAEERKYIQARSVDVEDWAMLNLTFTDDTKAAIFASDVTVGGVRNMVEAYTNGGVLLANMVSNNHLLSYMTDEEKIAPVYITEKVNRKTGWQFVSVGDEWIRGYLQEIQDFMECVSLGRQPLADLNLALDTVKATYAAYMSAETGQRVRL